MSNTVLPFVCHKCGKPAVGGINLLADAASGTPSLFVPVCGEHVATLPRNESADLASLRTENELLKRNMQRMVTGFRSHLGSLMCRIGPAWRPEHIKGALEDIFNAYNSWCDKSAEAERDKLREALKTIQQWDCLNPPATHLCADLGWLRQLVEAALA